MSYQTKSTLRSIHKTYIVNHEESFKRLVLSRDYKNLEYTIDFFVAGYKYNDGRDIIDLLSRNEQLTLVREHFNPYDPFAVAVYTKDFVRLGYVPSVISSFVSYWVDTEKGVKALIRDVRNKDIESDDTRIEVRAMVPIDAKFKERGKMNQDNMSS